MRWARTWRIALLVVMAPWVWGLASASCSRHALEEPPVLSARGEMHLRWARAHLEDPDFRGYGVADDLGVRAFDLVILSHLAAGLGNVAVLAPERADEVARLGALLAERAVSAEVSPSGAAAGEAPLGEQNLYASHLLFVLGVAHRLGVTEHDVLATRLARHLRERSLASDAFHARSYPGSARWPADQSVTLAALALHDREHGTELAAAPTRGWLRWLDAHRGADGLPWSTTGALGYARLSRGCALSWTSQWMAHFAPGDGARLYARYRAAHGISWLGWRGLREWPPGHDGGSDVDAGPVILGWGTAATGIGLGAARLYGDEASYAGIERIADTVGLRVPGTARYLLSPTLGQAILFAGETATFWGERPESLERTERDWPLGPLLLLSAFLALGAWLLRGLRRAA